MATVNIDLTVGTLQESVTVSGASPVVDVQSNAKQQVLTRDVLNAVPTSGTIQGLGQLVVGVTLNVPDVGGSRAMQQTYFAVRGQGGAQTVVLVDGMMTNGLMGDGAVQAYHNESMTQEAVYQTAGGNAETLTGGVNMNLIPKDGGNQFRGGFKAFKSPSSWQGDNLTDDLRALGVSAVDKIDNFYEWNVEQGGPIVKNKLWFFGAFRKAKYDRPIANTFYTPENVPFPVGYAACASGAISCEQGISDEKMDNPILRLTWQVSDRNKIAAYADRALRLRGHAMGSLTDPRTASVIWNTPNFRHRLAEVHVDDLVEAAARDRLLVQPRTLRQPVPARHPRRAQHARLVPERPPQRHQHGPAVGRLGRAARQLPGSLQRPGRALVRDRHAQHQVRRRLPVGHLSPLQQRQRRPLPDLQQRRAVPGHGAEHPPARAGRPEREPGLLRAGHVEPEPPDAELRPALRPQQADHRRPGRADRPLRQLAGVRRHRVPDVERLLAPPVGRLRHLGQRPHGRPRRLQQVRHGADHRVRAALQPDGADDPGAALDRRQRRRHRPGRARLHLPDRRLRNQLRQPARQLRRALAGAVRSGHQAPLLAGAQLRYHARTVPGLVGGGRVLPHRLQEHHDAPEHVC